MKGVFFSFIFLNQILELLKIATVENVHPRKIDALDISARQA